MSVTVEKTAEKTVITKEAGRPFRILQLTDIHIGNGLFTRKKDKRALADVKKVVEMANADMIVVTGDMCYPFWMWGASHNNLKASKRVAEVIESAGVPWCVVFGNHDDEIWAKVKKPELGKFYESRPNSVYRQGAEGVSGVSNYAIELHNSDGTINTALMFVDSNAYLSWHFFSGFDTIHDDQIEWYKRTINEMSGDGEQVKSLAFFHIPPKEFKEAWDKCWKGDKDVTYHLGFVGEKDNYFGYPKTKEGNFFKEMVEFGSCKGMFMGHDHLNTVSLTYQGIRMTYGMSIDYLAYLGIKKKNTQRGGTIIEIDDDGNFEVSHLPLN